MNINISSATGIGLLANAGNLQNTSANSTDKRLFDGKPADVNGEVIEPKTSVNASQESQGSSLGNGSDSEQKENIEVRTQQEKREDLKDPDSEASKLLRELQQRDREVRAHEQAHVAAAGPYAIGGPVYEFQSGPDGVRYAIGGHVKIDTGPVPGDPEATIRKAQVIRRAALAPAEPSAQDNRVASSATNLEAQARQELSEVRRIEQAEALEESAENASSSATEDERPKNAAERLEEQINASGGSQNPDTSRQLLDLVA